MNKRRLKQLYKYQAKQLRENSSIDFKRVTIVQGRIHQEAQTIPES